MNIGYHILQATNSSLLPKDGQIISLFISTFRKQHDEKKYIYFVAIPIPHTTRKNKFPES